MLFFYLGFIGGCSGSTAGGVKIFRFQVAYILLKTNLNQLIHPRAVMKQKYNGHRLDDEIVRSILTFSFFFTITICLIALMLHRYGFARDLAGRDLVEQALGALRQLARGKRRVLPLATIFLTFDSSWSAYGSMPSVLPSTHSCFSMRCQPVHSVPGSTSASRKSIFGSRSPKDSATGSMRS